MDTNHAPAACPNPACECDPCHCERPCTCGLVATQHSTHETWDPVLNEYRYIDIQTFSPTGPMPAVGKASHGNHGLHTAPATPGMAAELGAPVGHAGHGGSGNHGGDHEATHDQATHDLVGTVASFDPDDEAMTELQRRANEIAQQRHEHESTSVRIAEHNGHTIKVVTTYELLIDGKQLTGHMGVNGDGSVHYHGIPNYATESAVDLAKQIVDSFPDDYARPAPNAGASLSTPTENGAD